MIIPEEVLNQYNKVRHKTDTSVVCHAPFVSMNFEQNGNVRACCYNTQHILGKWPEQTIREIWESKDAETLRKYISKNDLGGGCSMCAHALMAKNFAGSRAIFYDAQVAGKIPSSISFIKHKLGLKHRYPKVMEFEISNQCNLECVMCNGHFSSSIRKNREKLPPLHSPYNDKFVEELEEFLPHLTDAKFLGGEPFMIDIYYKIWDRIKAVNPKMKVHITTNGTMLNQRIKDLVESFRTIIIISLDSLNKETYERIRVRSNFDNVMANIDYYHEYSLKSKNIFSIAVCPMIYNWKELPELQKFCIEKNATMHFNTVEYPKHLSLRILPPEELENIIQYLGKSSLEELPGGENDIRNTSVRTYNNFIHLLKDWKNQAGKGY